MKNEPKHSPLPWRIEHSAMSDSLLLRDATGNLVGCWPLPKTKPDLLRREADISLIVRAVNSHAALVEACEVAGMALANIGGMQHVDGKDAIAKVRAALALAKGGGK